MDVNRVILVQMLLVFLVACGGAPTEHQVINVSMTDFAFTLKPDHIHPGQVTFVVKNDAKSTIHQMVVVRTYLPADELPNAFGAQMVDEGSQVLSRVGEVGDLDPGKSATLTIKLDPGHYVYLCDTPGHYRMGMYGEFTVNQ